MVRNAIIESLDKDLPESYNKEVFIAKTNLILSLLVDKFVQGIGIACYIDFTRRIKCIEFASVLYYG